MLTLAAPISYGQAIILGLLQGFSELFPISSLGHSVILPQLLGWDIHQNDAYFITFLVATHLATAIVLLCFFLETGCGSCAGMWRSLVRPRDRPDNTDARLGWLLVVGTIPAGLLGLLLQDALRERVRLGPVGGVLPDAERGHAVRRRAAAPPRARHDVERGRRTRASPTPTSWRGALGIGAAQALALIPGFSRSGASMGGGLLVGLSNEDAARFSFLLATPIIGAAAALKLPDLFGHRRRRARAGARGRTVLRAHRLPLGAVPGPLFRDQPADAVRHLLLRGRNRLLHLLRGDLTPAPDWRTVRAAAIRTELAARDCVTHVVPASTTSTGWSP